MREATEQAPSLLLTDVKYYRLAEVKEVEEEEEES